MDCYSYRLKEAFASFSLKIFIIKKILETRFVTRNGKILKESLCEADLVFEWGLWDPTTHLERMDLKFFKITVRHFTKCERSSQLELLLHIQYSEMMPFHDYQSVNLCGLQCTCFSFID
jgi:hypothetical protein